MKIFISHSSNDVLIAKTLTSLLRSAFNLTAKEIRCTSVNGFRLPIGVKPKEKLRQEIYDSEVFIGLLTPESLNSHYVLFEMGARWGKELTIFPLLCSAGCIDLISGPLREINALDICDTQQAYQLITDLGKELDLQPEPTEVYSEYIESFSKQARKIGNLEDDTKSNYTETLQSLKNTTINLRGTEILLSEIFLTTASNFGIGTFSDDISHSLIKLCHKITPQDILTSSEENNDIIGELMILNLISERNSAGTLNLKYYLTDLGKEILKELKTNA